MLDQPSLNVSDLLSTHAKFRRTRTAFVCGDRRVTWGEFDTRVSKVANTLLDAGLQKGDKVALLSLSSIEALEIMFGTIRAGGVIVPISALLQPQMIATLIEDSASKFFFVASPLQALAAPILESLPSIPTAHRIGVLFEDEAYQTYEDFIATAKEGAPWVDLGNEDECNIIYSSGTTGMPKGIVLTHQARSLIALAAAVEYRVDSACTTLITTPPFTNATWVILLPSMAAGGVTVLLPSFSPQGFLDAVQQERATHTLMVPTQYHVILESPDLPQYDLSSLRIMISVGAMLPLPLKRRILERMGPGLLELYGLTEGVGTTLKPEDMKEKTGSVGTPIGNTDMRIIDDEGNELPVGEVGEIIGYSPIMMKGYLNRPEATADIIWRDERGRTYIRTGDMGRFDEDGFLYIMDRKRDMIVSGGLNVFASDIEEVFLQHPEILDVAVIAVPHEKWGETPLALVRLRDGAGGTEDELKEWANARLAKHQRVSAVELRDEDFPRNALGKVLKRELRLPYWPELA
jgi:acyl-CoA synthetase (AMP-forming)/AMP-acid ligase II